jgi:hypothetical protein
MHEYPEEAEQRELQNLIFFFKKKNIYIYSVEYTNSIRLQERMVVKRKKD